MDAISGLPIGKGGESIVCRNRKMKAPWSVSLWKGCKVSEDVVLRSARFFCSSTFAQCSFPHFHPLAVFTPWPCPLCAGSAVKPISRVI